MHCRLVWQRFQAAEARNLEASDRKHERFGLWIWGWWHWNIASYDRGPRPTVFYCASQEWLEWMLPFSAVELPGNARRPSRAPSGFWSTSPTSTSRRQGLWSKSPRWYRRWIKRCEEAGCSQTASRARINRSCWRCLIITPNLQFPPKYCWEMWWFFFFFLRPNTGQAFSRMYDFLSSLNLRSSLGIILGLWFSCICTFLCGRKPEEGVKVQYSRFS